LNSILITLKPAFRSINFDILAPDANITVNRVIGHTENGPFSKVLAHHCQSTLLNQTRKAERKGRSKAESLVDAGIEIRQTFDLSNGCDQLVFRSQLFIEFPLKCFLDAWIAGEVMDDGAN
jgi:hypothetical protein